MASLSGIQFGAGIILASPNGGQLAVDPTPQEVGIIQDISLTVSGDIKELYGQFQWSVDSAVGKRGIKGSFNFAQLSNNFLNQLFFADTVAPGIVEVAYREPHSIPASTPYTITIAPPGSGTFVQDFGVTSQITGFALTNIGTGTPTTGQYIVDASTGVYTFAAADEGVSVWISYTYLVVSTGTTLTVANHPMGWGPVVQLLIPFLYQGNKYTFNLPNVRLGKIDIKTKIDDYTMISTDFSGFAGAGNNPLSVYMVD